MRKLAALTLLFSAFVSPANANDLENNGEETEQVIPPAIVYGQVNPTEPLDLSEIEITTKTPADEFISATTPLLVALMLGSVGLVVFTLVSQSRKESARLD
ncbi:MAG: hypothetical protein RLZZ579_1080 [Actinomycetota bacterium]